MPYCMGLFSFLTDEIGLHSIIVVKVKICKKNNVYKFTI